MYTQTARVLHWLIAGMIVLQYLLANLAESADSTIRQLALYANHKSVGITILLLAVIRLAWRQKNRPPALPPTMPPWQTLASSVSHWSLYGLLFLLPLSGWLMSSASAYSVSLFNLVQLPDLVAPDEALLERLKSTHNALAKLLFVLAAVHIGAAVKHAIIDKDGVLRRISSGPALGLFAAVIVGGVVGLTRGTTSAPTSGTDTSTVGAAERLEADSALPAWQIDYAESYIRFRATQAGAEFQGTWPSWQASIRFDGGRPADGAFDVGIDTTDVSTSDADRDSTIGTSEWFDTANHPEARYQATRFRVLKDGGFAADGMLYIKGNEAPVVLDFTIETTTDGRRVLAGTALVDRLALNVGTGDWADTTWIGQEVTVEVRVEAIAGD